MKIGDRVRVVKVDPVDMTLDIRVGDTGEIIGEDWFSDWLVKLDDSEYYWPFNENQLQVIGGSMFDQLKVGDVLVDEKGDERTVLAKVDRLVALSDWNEPEEFYGNDWLTERELGELGFRLKTDPQEVTMEQVCDKFGYEVKIKKEK